VKTTDLLLVIDKLYHKAGFQLTMLVVIGSDCIGSYESNYNMIPTTMAPFNFRLQ